jgi:hypothetical protein
LGRPSDDRPGHKGLPSDDFSIVDLFGLTSADIYGPRSKSDVALEGVSLKAWS